MTLELHERWTPALRNDIRDLLADAACATPDNAPGVEHDPAWLDALRDGMGHRPLALVHRSAGGIDAYLPLAWVRSRLFGRFLVSLPYLNRAGVVAHRPESAIALIDHAHRLAEEGRAHYLELRHETDGIEHAKLTETRGEKSRMLLDLPGNGEALWKQLPGKVRNQIRKGERSDLQLQWGGRELARAFHGVFSVVMRDLGTPVYPRRFFEAIAHHLERQAEFAVVWHNGLPVAGALLIHDDTAARRVTAVPSAACLRTANPLNANMWMYHRLLERAVERGSERFDFGRSSEGSGTWKFKKQWGA
ncbi:MAG: GNAT family N-acetyltransferase, partial [Phycisphaeraceae bacterium]